MSLYRPVYSFRGHSLAFLLRPAMGADYCDQSVCRLSVCVSVCPRAYLWNRWTYLHEMFCADPLWPCLAPALTALPHVMHFRFYE